MSTANKATMPHYGDNFILVLRFWPVSDPGDQIRHTPEKPFCPDLDCPCHECDTESRAKVHQLYLDGLITADHATDIIMGRMPL